MELMATGITGLRAATTSIAGSAARVAAMGTGDSAPETDLPAEFVNLKVQGAAYKANLKVIETADEMLGTALDLKA